MTPAEAEADAQKAQERYAMLQFMIEWNQAEHERYERQMAAVRPRVEEDKNDG